jgi:glycosyltransferase involved in cell wall biosynthesis
MTARVSIATDRPVAPGQRPLRVLVVMPLGTALGGGEEMLRQLLREGRGRGIEWIVAFLRDGPLVDELRALGVECHVIEAGRFRQIWRRVAAVRRVAALARASNADLCFGWMVAGQAMAGPAALLAGVPCAWYQVGTPRPDWLDRFATLWPAAGVLALSHEGLAAQARLWPRRPVTLVHPGVALDRAAAARATPPAAMRARLGLPGAGPIVGTVSRLQRWKGVHVFLDAVALLRRARPDLHAVVVGGPHETEPEYERELHEQAARLGMADAVTFAGFRANAVEWMQAMDVVVHAAAREPFGIVVVEAMALGKPVVAGAAGGPAEIVRDGVDGLLVPYGDAAGIARAVERFLTTPGFAAAAGAAAMARAAEFSATAFATNVCEAVRRMASRAGHSGA